MFPKLLLVTLATVIGSSYAVNHWIRSERVTDYGVWGPVEQCWPGSFVQSFMLKTEPNQGPFNDDTAGNAIQVNCVNPLTGVATGSIRSLEGPWGNWGSHFTCLPSFASGFTLRSEDALGSGDDTAMNNLRLHCTDGKTVQGDGLAFGSWRSEISCLYSRHAICGLQTQIEPNQGSGDDSALNNVDFLCCELPNPAKHCQVAKESSWSVVQQCESSESVTDCQVEVGVSVEYHEDQLDVAKSWEGAGFTLKDAVNELPAVLTGAFRSQAEANRTTIQMQRTISLAPHTMSTFYQESRTCGHYVVRLPKLRRTDVSKSGVETVTLIDL